MVTPLTLNTMDPKAAFICFAATLAVAMGLALYFKNRRISRHICYLRDFALKAERGEPLDTELERRLPDDALGEVSHTIINLYWKLHYSEVERDRIKHQLTQNAAHELKTPTASIHGYLESILSNPDMPADQRQHFLERCYAQSERMVGLLRDISTLNQLSKPDDESGIKRECVDVRGVIDSVIDDVAQQTAELGLNVERQLPETIHVDGDPSYLYSIFRNIIDNILAYALGATKVAVRCNDYPDFYEFVIADNGPGIPPEHLGRVFERFYRIDSGRSRKIGGTGLGMAIVKNAVLAHGGTCSAEVTPGGGLTIRFTLNKVKSEELGTKK